VFDRRGNTCTSWFTTGNESDEASDGKERHFDDEEQQGHEDVIDEKHEDEENN
jgi:hypothetical protein